VYISIYVYVQARSQTSSGAFVTTLDPCRAPTCTPCLYRATNCLRNENIVPVNKWLHCAGRAVLFVITNRSLHVAWPLGTQAHARGRERKKERETCLFRLVQILNLRLNNDLLFDLDYRVSQAFIGPIEYSTTVRKRSD